MWFLFHKGIYNGMNIWDNNYLDWISLIIFRSSFTIFSPWVYLFKFQIGNRFQRNWPKTARFFYIFTVSYKQNSAYKIKIRIFLKNPPMPICHTFWHLTWCKVKKIPVFWEKPKMCSFISERAYKTKILILYKKKAPSLFSIHRPLTTCQVSEQNN